MSHESPVGASVEWYTPPELFQRLGIETHWFDLDPASPASGPVSWIPAKRFYSSEQDGLKQPWEGRVWLNPPYGPTGVNFIKKMAYYRHGMMLIPARTETRIFQWVAEKADVVTFLRDRLHFIREDGFQGRAGFASALFAWGDDCTDALLAANLGWSLWHDRNALLSPSR